MDCNSNSIRFDCSVLGRFVRFFGSVQFSLIMVVIAPPVSFFPASPPLFRFLFWLAFQKIQFLSFFLFNGAVICRVPIFSASPMEIVTEMELMGCCWGQMKMLAFQKLEFFSIFFSSTAPSSVVFPFLLRRRLP